MLVLWLCCIDRACEAALPLRCTDSALCGRVIAVLLIELCAGVPLHICTDSADTYLQLQCYSCDAAAARSAAVILHGCTYYATFAAVLCMAALILLCHICSCASAVLH